MLFVANLKRCPLWDSVLFYPQIDFQSTTSAAESPWNPWLFSLHGGCVSWTLVFLDVEDHHWMCFLFVCVFLIVIVEGEESGEQKGRRMTWVCLGADCRYRRRSKNQPVDFTPWSPVSGCRSNPLLPSHLNHVNGDSTLQHTPSRKEPGCLWKHFLLPIMI